MTNAYVPEPTLELRDETPVSAAFGDVYFSRAGGVAETSHVFLAGNGLPERWAAASAFRIAELGFGTGLNFLVTLKRFRETAPVGARLEYHAVEKFPFTREVLRDVLALQPELAAEATELLAAYPLRLPGPHRMVFGSVVLNLWFGEVGEWLEHLQRAACPPFAPAALTPAASRLAQSATHDHYQQSGCINAWYLDGFAPAKNPDMWGERILAAIAHASAPGATFATFTAASAVRRGLEAVGFAVRKVPGFGRKREMLVGSRGEVVAAPSSKPSSAIVIGAGIAGAALARALAERGYSVTVLERDAVASGASGNEAGVLFPPLTKRWSTSTAFYFAAYDWVLRLLAHSDGVHASPGMLRLPRHAEEEAQLQQLHETLGLDASIAQWISREAASAKAGVALPTGAAYFAHGTWVSPKDWCEKLLQHKNSMLRTKTVVESLTKTTGGWRVTLASGDVLEAPLVCVAAANESTRLLAEYGLRLQGVGGQISRFAAKDVVTPLSMILCRKGYVIPHGEQYLVGATYHREELLAVTQARHAETMAELENLLPGWLRGNATDGRSSVRATTPDRMPYIGMLDDGLYVSTGHGSRGLLSGPLGAEMIACAIDGQIAPVTEAMARSVDPRRFKQ